MNCDVSENLTHLLFIKSKGNQQEVIKFVPKVYKILQVKKINSKCV